MAKSSYVQTLLGTLDSDTRRVFSGIFDYVLQNLRVGRPTDQARSENLQAYFLTGTTPAVADTEFSIAHGLASAPYLLMPVLDLQGVNAQLVPLYVTRAADASRVYLASPETNAAFTVLVEAPGV
jgi:hypothetical protein